VKGEQGSICGAKEKDFRGRTHLLKKGLWGVIYRANTTVEGGMAGQTQEVVKKKGVAGD